jgi:hypothetical protein
LMAEPPRPCTRTIGGPAPPKSMKWTGPPTSATRQAMIEVCRDRGGSPPRARRGLVGDRRGHAKRTRAGRSARVVRRSATGPAPVVPEEPALHARRHPIGSGSSSRPMPRSTRAAPSASRSPRSARAGRSRARSAPVPAVSGYRRRRASRQGDAMAAAFPSLEPRGRRGGSRPDAPP